MLERNELGNGAKMRGPLTPLDLLTLLLAGLWLLALPGLSGAASWDETLAAAKKENKLVVVLGGGASRRYRPVFQYFEDKFGIETVVSTGSGRKQADRLLAERGARRYKVDLIMTGGTTGNTRLLPNGVIDPITPELFLPDVVDKSLWYKGRHYYSDPKENYIFAFSAAADLTPIAMRFNTDRLPIKKAQADELCMDVSRQEAFWWTNRRLATNLGGRWWELLHRSGSSGPWGGVSAAFL